MCVDKGFCPQKSGDWLEDGVFRIVKKAKKIIIINVYAFFSVNFK